MPSYTKGEWTTKAGFIQCGDKIIAEAKSCGIEAYRITVVEARANAQLIASAPDLYEACKQALRTFEARGISPTDDRRRLLEKALAKAEMK